MLHVWRHDHPIMFVDLVNRMPWRGKLRIGEGADSERDAVGVAAGFPIDGGSATRAEMEHDLVAAVAGAGEYRRRAFNSRHLRPRIVDGIAERTARAPLAGEAMTDGNAHGLAFAGDAQLSAAA